MTVHIANDADVLWAADLAGFTLLQREVDTGQLVWTWIPRNEQPQPRFLTRREAIAFMSEKLGLH